ncbi:MAG: TolC family protein [Massilia sp.]|nr:TolC family protein [Massilia sp.]
MSPLKNFGTALLSGALLCVAVDAVAATATTPQQLTLAQAIEVAFAHNPDLRQSVLGVDGAAAMLEVASAQPNPTLTVQTMGINPRAGIGAGSLRAKTVDSTLRLDQLIERGGKRGFRMDAARGLEQAAKADLHDVRRRLRQQVSLAYYDLLSARERLNITRQSAQLFDSTVQAAQKRQRAGDLAPADVARAQVDALRAHNDALQAQSDVFQMQQSLLLIMGQPIDGGVIEPSDSWPVNPPPGAPVADSVLLLRADVRAAQARLDAALSSRQLALASRVADVTVVLQAEHFPATASNGQGSGNSYGIALQIPLFVRYAYGGEIRSAAVAADMARENLDQVRVVARSELQLAAVHLRVAYQRMRRDDDELLVVAKKSADAAEFAFAHGALGIMDLLDVRRTYRSAQLDALAAHADYAKSLTDAQAAASESTTE